MTTPNTDNEGHARVTQHDITSVQLKAYRQRMEAVKQTQDPRYRERRTAFAMPMDGLRAILGLPTRASGHPDR
jgi:hypothetical protein